MDRDQVIFNDVSLLITHYNRSKSLERLLKSFEELNMTFKEVIVSDDASKPVHLDYIKELQGRFNFRLVGTPQNKGLANNLNKGQDAVKTRYTLYVQEDFVPLPAFKISFPDALQFMEEDRTLDIVRFYAYTEYPYLKPFKKGYSEILYKPWYLKTHKIYNYSDHPHLRRSSFLERFGRYTEGIKSDKTEYEMCLSFIQNKGRALFYDQFKALFIQENSSEEPSTVQRSDWRQDNGWLISIVRTLYRQIKYNYDLHGNTKFKQ